MEQGHKANSCFNNVVMSDVVVFALCVCVCVCFVWKKGLLNIKNIMAITVLLSLSRFFLKKCPDPLPNVLFIKYFFFLFFVHSFILIINHHNNSF